MEVAELLKGLHEEIWGPPERRWDRIRGSYEVRQPKGPLTMVEWNTLLNAIQELDLPVLPCSCNYGFGVGFEVYVKPPTPQKVGPLLDINQDHFPAEFVDPNLEYDRKMDKLHDLLEPFTHSEKNLRNLRFVGMENELKPIRTYRY